MISKLPYTLQTQRVPGQVELWGDPDSARRGVGHDVPDVRRGVGRELSCPPVAVGRELAELRVCVEAKREGLQAQGRLMSRFFFDFSPFWVVVFRDD